MENNLPAVSVIIPMYNVEKYIGELLESLSAQTLKNFEAIIVNNGSTDGSAVIVENYIKLVEDNDRFNLINIEKNTGGPSIPRNQGLEISRGKYIFFMDSDDVLTPTALEEMYTLAEKFQADVIYCERYFMSEGIGEDFKRNIHVAETRIQSGEFVKEPTILSDDLSIRFIEYFQNRFWMTPWLRLLSRDFLINNDIKFPIVNHQNDGYWACEVLFLAKKFVRVPNICYIRRMRTESLSSMKKNVNQFVRRWLERDIKALKNLDSFMNKLEFFRQHSNYRYAILNRGAFIDLQNTLMACADLPADIIYEIIKEEFADYLGKDDVLVAYLITNNLMMIKNLIRTQQELDELRQSYKSFNN